MAVSKEQQLAHLSVIEITDNDFLRQLAQIFHYEGKGFKVTYQARQGANYMATMVRNNAST